MVNVVAPPSETPAPVADRPWTFQTLIEDLADRGDSPAIVTVRGEAVTAWSFAEIADHAARVATGLLRAGVAPGEPVMMFAPNSPEWVVVRFALGAVAALVVPLDDLSTPDEVERWVRDSGCRRIFASSDHVAELRALPGGARLELFVLDDGPPDSGVRSWRELLAERAEPLPPIDAEAAATLIYTSGTTGRPKGFTLSCANIWANVAALAAEGILRPGERVLLPLPLHHVYPLVIGLLVPLVSGSTVVFPEAVTGPEIVQALRAGEVGVIIGVPRLYAALYGGLAARVSARGRVPATIFRTLLNLSIRLRRRYGVRAGKRLFGAVHKGLGGRLWLMVSGGAQLPEDLIWTLEGLGWEVRSGYGLAETASTFTGNLPDGRERIGSEGRPFQGGEIRIADPDEDGVGEVQLRGPNVFSGYRDPEDNRAAFTEDGWFHTGDLGYLDDDAFLYICGRTKEMIVLGGGKNVFPEELEKAYGDSPFIREVAVLERAGALHALVLPDLEAIRASGTPRIADTVRVTLTSQSRPLPSYQRLAGFALVREPLPRTRLGKYQRFLLPDIYEKAREGTPPPAAAELSAEDRAFLAQPLVREAWAILEARYGDKGLGLDANPQLDLGIDSLEWVTLSLELERRLGVRLTEDEAADTDTVRDLLRALTVAAQRPAAAAPEAHPVQALLTDQDRWTAPPGVGSALLGATLLLLDRLLFRTLFRLRAEGGNHLPRNGPLVVVVNHVSDLDPFALAAAMPFRLILRTHWSGDVARLFAGPVLRAFCRAVNIFPVDERAPAATLAMATAVLSHGRILAWFPEAWRSPTGELQPFLPGIGRLLSESRVPVVPAYIAGTFEAMPRWRRLPHLHPIKVAFGEAVTVDSLEAAGQGDTPEARIVDALQSTMAALAAQTKSSAERS